MTQLAKMFRDASYSHDTYTLFSDCVAAMALSISNSVDLTQYDKRELRYMEIVNRYNKDVVDKFPKIFAEVTMALEAEPSDVLGETFHELELHNKARGQYFTPASVCRLMAEMQIDDSLKERVEAKGFIRAHEPACGSGAMVIALAEAMQSRGINYQQQLHVTAVDIDERAAHMAYVQFSLLHIPAIVTVGNTLSGEMRESFYTPAHILGGWSSKLYNRQEAEMEAERVDVQKADEVLKPDIELEPVQQEMFGMGGGLSL